MPTLPRSRRPAHNWAANERSRIRGRRLQQLRAHLFTVEPLCRPCAAEGRTTIATIRDHIIPLAERGDDSPGNIQPICADCSKAKTREESQRGRRTARTGAQISDRTIRNRRALARRFN